MESFFDIQLSQPNFSALYYLKKGNINGAFLDAMGLFFIFRRKYK